MTDSYELFKQQIKNLTTINLDCYKERQMKRRIDALITKKGMDSYAAYYILLKKNREELNEFVTYLTINVSEFYRNPEQWEMLEQEIYPYLTQKFGKKLRIWSAACSTGDEPYSLAMMLAKYMPLNQISILATDIDTQILDKAKYGLYLEKSLKGLPKEFVAKYFTKVTDKAYKIHDDVKKCVEFKKHDLLLDEYPSQCDLIICRNVLIYFTEEAKVEIYKNFNRALKGGGILFVGSTEQIIQPQLLNFMSRKSFFYQKINE